MKHKSPLGMKHVAHFIFSEMHNRKMKINLKDMKMYSILNGKMIKR